MKKKAISILLTLAMLMGINASAATYQKSGNAVTVDGSGFNTIMIRKQGENGDVVYLNQNDSGFEAAQEFLIKDKPEDGTYDVLMGKSDGTSVEPQSFTITSALVVSGTITNKSHIQKIEFTKQGETDASATVTSENITDNAFQVMLKEGTYNISVTTADGYRLKSTINPVTVNDDVENIPIETEPVCIKGAVGDNITSVELQTAGGQRVGEPITEFNDGNFSFEAVPDGQYKLVAAADSGYTANDITVTVSDKQDSTGHNVTAEAIKRTIKAASDAGIKSVTLTASGKEPVAGEINEAKTEITFSNITIGEYNVEIEYNDEYKEKTGHTNPASFTVDGEGATNPRQLVFASEVITYQISLIVDENVKQITLTDKTDSSKTYGWIKGNDAEIIYVPKGSYTVSVVCEKGYSKVQGTVSELEAPAVNSLTVNTELIPDPVYTVTGTVDAGVKSVTLKCEGKDDVPGVINSETNRVTFDNVYEGTYTVNAVPAEDYEIKEISSETISIGEGGTDDLFTVTTEKVYFIVTGTVTNKEGISSITFKNSNTETEMPMSSIDGEGKFSIKLRKGTYTIVTTPAGGYMLSANSAAEVEIANDGTIIPEIVAIEVEIIPVKYTVSGSADEGVQAVILKKDNDTIETITEFSDGSFTFENLGSGTYTVEYTVKEGYEKASITNNGIIEITNTNIAGIEITTKKIEVPAELKSTTRIEKTQDEIVLTTTLSDTNTEGVVIAAAYGADTVLIQAKTAEIQNGEAITRFEDSTDIKSFKILVWESLEGMKPLTKTTENINN